MSIPSSPSHEDGGGGDKETKETEKASDSSTESLSSNDAMILKAYSDTKLLMEAPSGVLDTVSTIVSLRNAVAEPPLDDGSGGMQHGSSSTVSLLTPNRGHHAIVRALEKLEGLEKEESELVLRSLLTTELTKIATGDDRFISPQNAIETLEALSQSVPRRVCQHPFKKNDIVWVCRTCQADETCVLCHSCYKQSNHEGHDVAFYHAQAGGCCDCGDPDAWDPTGFCPHHGPASTESCFSADGSLGPLSGSVLQRVQGVIPATIDWMVEVVAPSAEDGYARAEEESSETIASNSKSAARSNVTPIVGTTGDIPMVQARTAVFSPSAAGSSRSRRGVPAPSLSSMATISSPNTSKISTAYTKAERLGFLAREGGGLYLILKSDDINTHPQIVDALRELFGTSSLYSESILQKVVRSLKQFGQLVVWGTMELLADLNATQIRLWLDGDRVASGVLGAAMLHRANILKSHGMFCAILTRQELQLEQRAVVALQWLTCLARSCDPLCQKVAEAITPDRHLAPLLQCDFKLSSSVTKYWHSLLLTLLAVPTFKSHLAAAYCDTYQVVTAEYARGMGVLERSGYALSVQFLNRVTYVVDLVQRRDLLGKLGASLLQTLEVAAGPATTRSTMTVGTVTRTVDITDSPNDGRRRLDPNHFVLTHRRYSPCISDLKCVLNVKGMPRLFASMSSSFLKDWIASLALGQMMDPQTWRDWSQGHVELEVRGWVGAFNASISLGSLFERLLSWDDADPSPIPDENSPLTKNLLSCVDLTNYVLTSGVMEWQNLELASNEAPSFSTAVEACRRSSVSLPFSTTSVKSGSVHAFRAIPISQVTPFSFHLPLHRFVAACLREACLRDTGIDDLLTLLSRNLSDDTKDGLFLGLMEFPLLVLSRAAQIRAGLWRRNGNGLNDQVLNYAEPPFCRAMRDADLLLVQFAILGRTRFQTTDCRPESDVGTCFMIHLLLHRLGLFEYCGLLKAPDSDINRYLDEVQKGLYQSEKSSEGTTENFMLPSTFSPAKDAATFLLLLEEFLHLIIILCSELPGIPPKDKAEHTKQAKWRLRREVIHRLVSGEKTHSELAEVHHVLSHWDNVFLSEEGKMVNPDDATGAALASVLSDIASRKVSRGKMEPDKWELNREAWDSYDPSFFHINSRSHQQAADNRPSLVTGTKFNFKPKPFCPPLLKAHPSFSRLRRDITSDSTILAITYRTLHMHIRDSERKKDFTELPGSIAYEAEERSETALARAVHLLTLGAFAWQHASADNSKWRQEGGGSIGSIFFDRSDDAPAPTAKEWVSTALLGNPRIQQSSDVYEGEETCLQLLRRLAVDGGYIGCFLAQDQAVKAGAAWLCEFAAANNIEASRIVYSEENKVDGEKQERQETELERRKRMAKERAMAMMKAQAAKFKATTTELDDENEENEIEKDEATAEAAASQRHMFHQGSFASGSSVASASDSDKATPVSSETTIFLSDIHVPSRLLTNRPQCIICNSDDATSERQRVRDEELHRKSRKRRNERGNALAFVGYTQASTVMKGGGGPPSCGNFHSSFSPVRRFVGAHLALCGHAIHSECWESYLASVSHREDRIIGKRDEFRCPLCQNLSNCLVPFIDVGLDWIDSASRCDTSAMDISKAKSDDNGIVDSMSCETMDFCWDFTLNDFLLSTPWWVSRHNTNIMWDGQCAFIAESKRNHLNTDSIESANLEDIPAPKRRSSVRGLSKKDLYAAWNAMMKTPRFLKRRLTTNQDRYPESMAGITPGPDSNSNFATSSSESLGETVVWRRFMDQVSDITYRADGKRLGDENLHSDFGEFRHYIVEKYAYNMAYRFAGKETTDWPSCVFSTALSDTERQELSREKLLSKLMMSIQAFTYTSCCEINEARRLTRNVRARISTANMTGASSTQNDIDRIFSIFGIIDVVCYGQLVIMPRPNGTEDDGIQPFHGRLGKLRYFGLAVMAAAGAVAADLVQLVLAFPVKCSSDQSAKPYRAPIAYPILYGHVLTHITAAICASAGRARARSDSLEVHWPIPFSTRGSFAISDNDYKPKDIDSVVNDSEGFIKLGLLARVLQVLLGKIDMLALNNIAGLHTEFVVLRTLQKLKENLSAEASSESKWTINCILLLEVALSKHRESQAAHNTHAEAAILHRFEEGCILAAEAAISFVSDAGGILQLLIPGIMERYLWSGLFEDGPKDGRTFGIWNNLESIFQLESIAQMLESESVCEVVSNWYETARSHAMSTSLPSPTISGSGAAVTNRLFQTQGFRTFDWPMESCHNVVNENQGIDLGGNAANNNDPETQGLNPMEFDDVDTSLASRGFGSSTPPPSSSAVIFHSKRSVPLIGGFAKEIPVNDVGRPRIATIPISYTDLYAQLGLLLPDSEQTAVCLICGEVLNAGGKGECTKHSYKCGAGAGLFFLLQECTGLIMHNGKAAYIHSPYVDSHGETPQYRGRPLNLDMDRYDLLHEVWSGHRIRQQVLSERGKSRQIIVPDFY
ncbi:zinc-finger domain containing protein [Nitzschia inconspicua]|uniref:E3 ubiquitin-protein ligase n=1 Tax=Nitzschia inconspicua TaxID=303405 RepID=A0A9K3LRV0_9STRA|nr:zinc-finger domain containing protein [Nitzschia inconspicua]